MLILAKLYRQNSEGSLDCHWQASLSMLERRGPLRHTVGIEHSLFVEFRVHWVCNFSTWPFKGYVGGI